MKEFHDLVKILQIGKMYRIDMDICRVISHYNGNGLSHPYIEVEWFNIGKMLRANIYVLKDDVEIEEFTVETFYKVAKNCVEANIEIELSRVFNRYVNVDITPTIDENVAVGIMPIKQQPDDNFVWGGIVLT